MTVSVQLDTTGGQSCVSEDQLGFNLLDLLALRVHVDHTRITNGGSNVFGEQRSLNKA